MRSKLFLFLILTVIDLLFTSCGTSSFDKNLNEIYSEACYVSTLSNDITEQTISTWSIAINDNKDSHGDFCYDFNRAIQTLYSDFQKASVIDSLSFHFYRMETLAKEMSNCPSNRKEVFDELVVLVSEIKNHYKKAMEPSGNLQEFSQESRAENSSIEKSLSQFEIKHSNILNNIKMYSPSLQKILLEYEINKAEILAAELDQFKETQRKFLEENKNKEGVEELPSGLQIKTITEGVGKKPQENSVVVVNYKGMLVDGKQFDSQNSIEFNVNYIINGFKEGLMNMKQGGKSVLYIPSDLAYGDKGLVDHVPGGSTVILEVELLKVK